MTGWGRGCVNDREMGNEFSAQSVPASILWPPPQGSHVFGFPNCGVWGLSYLTVMYGGSKRYRTFSWDINHPLRDNTICLQTLFLISVLRNTEVRCARKM